MSDENVVVEQQGTAQAGVETPSVEITDEMIKAHPLYQRVLEESIERRKELKALKSQTKAEKEPETPKTVEADMPEWAKSLQAQFNAVSQQLKVAQEQGIQTTIKLALTKYGLPESAAPFIQADTEEQILAKAKALNDIRGISTSVGGTTQSDKPEDRYVKRLKDSMTETSTLLTPERAKDFWS